MSRPLMGLTDKELLAMGEKVYRLGVKPPAPAAVVVTEEAMARGWHETAQAKVTVVDLGPTKEKADDEADE